jgi:hypothetical protein
MINKDDPKWQELTQDILSGMAEWRQHHPKSTFSEIERRSFFPLDEELALLPGSLTSYVHESLDRMGAWMPFKFIAEHLEDLIE